MLVLKWPHDNNNHHNQTKLKYKLCILKICFVVFEKRNDRKQRAERTSGWWQENNVPKAFPCQIVKLIKSVIL